MCKMGTLSSKKMADILRTTLVDAMSPTILFVSIYTWLGFYLMCQIDKKLTLVQVKVNTE